MLKRASARNVVLNFNFLITLPFFDLIYQKIPSLTTYSIHLSNISYESEILSKLFIL
jgi:hypothetical protein